MGVYVSDLAFSSNAHRRNYDSRMSAEKCNVSRLKAVIFKRRQGAIYNSREAKALRVPHQRPTVLRREKNCA